MDASRAIAMWLAEGEIDPATAQCLRRSLANHEELARANSIIWVLASIGAVLVGAGLLLFIASQWDQSSPLRRLLLLLFIYLIVVAGAAMAERQNLGITAKGLWFLSSLTVGANIFLVGQIYNLPLNYWQGTLLWLVATVAMGWASPSSAQGWLALPLGILTLGWISVPNAAWFDQWAFLVDPAGLLPLLPLVGLALVASAMVLDDSSFDWLQRPAVAFGSLLVALPLTVSTFHPVTFAAIFGIDFRFFHLVVVALSIGAVGVALIRHRQSLLGMGLGVLTLLLVIVLPGRAYPESGLDFDDRPVSWLAPRFEDSTVLFMLYGALIFGLAVAAILAGQRHRVQPLINVGFAMVAVILFAFYVGRIAGSLPTAMAVIVGGLLLVGGAIVLERKRREVNTDAAIDGPEAQDAATIPPPADPAGEMTP